MKRIQFLDTTLRDGEQAPQNAMNPQQKLRIAKKLVEAGVDYVETGFPASSRFDFEATKLIAAELQDIGVATFSRTLVSDIEIALRAAGTDRRHMI